VSVSAIGGIRGGDGASVNPNGTATADRLKNPSDGTTGTAAANGLKAPAATTWTTTANGVKAPTTTTWITTANSLKAPGRSYRRASLRASLTAFAAVLASSGRRRATGPFHSRPCRLIRQSVRVGMKGATRSTRPGRCKHRRPKSS